MPIMGRKLMPESYSIGTFVSRSGEFGREDAQVDSLETRSPDFPGTEPSTKDETTLALQPQSRTRIMTNSLLRIAGAVGAVIVMTAAMCNKDGGDAAKPPADVSVASAVTSSGSGLPADFPLDPALSPCKPVIAGPEVICDWHGVDGHQVYAFYIEALPKAGYGLIPGSIEGNVGKPSYRGAIRFKKGSVLGAVNISGGYVSIQLFTGQ
jgi:hypothetical protein